MKKIISLLIVCILLITGCSIIETPINEVLIRKLSATTRIVIINENIDSKSNIIGTITNNEVIEEIVDIFKDATTVLNGFYTCIGTSIYFEMYDNKENLIDTVGIWVNEESIMPKSIDKVGCGRYSIPSSNKSSLKSIIEQETNYKFYTLFDYSENCNDVLELVYEDDNYKYYFSCEKSDKVFIEFWTSGLKITLKEALNDNYITVNELLEAYPHLFIKLEN